MVGTLGSVLYGVSADGGDGVQDTVNAIQATSDQVLLALIAVIATSIAALIWVIKNGRIAKEGLSNAISANEQATAANNAVNNVGPGQHTLYEMISNIRDDVDALKKERAVFDGHGWDHLPSDLGNAVSLTLTVRAIQAEQSEHRSMLRTILDRLERVAPGAGNGNGQSSADDLTEKA